MPLRHLFIDMNAFFASCEQQMKPKLRNKPVAVIPTKAETTFVIAASYEAKEFGVRTGTPVWEARKLCPGIVFREADHQRYVIIHNRVIEAIERVIPIENVVSIDEMSCRLVGDERKPEVANDIARRIKQEIYARAGSEMHCSIGIGPNVMLAKVATDMKKPNGLTWLSDADLPHKLHPLKLTDFPGVAKRMQRRFNLNGIFTVEQFCSAPAKTLALIWGSKLLGERWYRLLHGEEVADTPTQRRTVSHSHVLPPELRTDAGAFGVLMKLVHKAAARMRKIGYWCGAVSVSANFLGGGSPHDPRDMVWWGESVRIPRCHDTPTILAVAMKLWEKRIRDRKPFKIAMALSDLVPNRSATPSLFDEDRQGEDISRTLDMVNSQFGASVIYLGAMFGMRKAAPPRIAFTQIPDFDRQVN